MNDIRSIDARLLHEVLTRGRELALLDVREQGVFGRAHLLVATNLPFGRLELGVDALVPRHGVCIVLCDGGEGLAERAGRHLLASGYEDVSVLDGGIDAWRAAGHELFSGLNVPSKAFGEYVEHHFGTPHLSARELRSRLSSGEELVILDSRPMEEFAVMNIPGGIDAPGAELVYRVRDLAPDPRTRVVVNCAGRTRSIIGCQSLVNAGLRNPLAALEDGTMGWTLAGETLERGARRSFGEVSRQALEWSRQASERVARRFGVRKVSRATLGAWLGERESCTLQVFDVRQPREYEEGHLPGSRSAPGGQLVQATDAYLAVRSARIVLVDDTEVRAVMTASWLVQMGFPAVFVLEGGIGDQSLESGPEPRRIVSSAGDVPALSAADLAGMSGAQVVDFSTSRSYTQGHIPGAAWAVRSDLAHSAAQLPAARFYVVTAEDAALARLAAVDLAAAVAVPVRRLAGGNAAWRSAGLRVETGARMILSDVDDVYERPYDLEDDQEAAMRAYLSWEVALAEQVRRDDTVHFPAFDARVSDAEIGS